ncbi:MAG: hypothetical protein EAZ89_19790 [Bacteroidetes bacterium]|nr:MAG: hypothetical protein EAZ89_19790 [Bacteroidota bacterium]
MLWLIFASGFTSYSPDERDIYGQVIRDFVDKGMHENGSNGRPATLLIRKRPANFDVNRLQQDTGAFSRLRSAYRQLDLATFHTLLEKNQANPNSEAIEIQGVQVVVIDSDIQLNQEASFSMYPDWNGQILEFSPIGFNDEHTQTLLYVGFEWAPIAGGGAYFIYEKKGRHWKKKKMIPVWAA